MNFVNQDLLPPQLAIGRRLEKEVLQPMKQSFVGKDEIVDLLGVCLVAGENLFLLGPPGTAKTALVQDLASRLNGRSFDYLLTRFTEPSELFGPFDLRRLREGELVTNTEGMLPEAALVFLDELLNANSAILNSLLMALNERMFRRGKETRPLQALMFVGASNHLPEDDALKALFDRFLLRVRSDNVSSSQLMAVLEAGWRFQERGVREGTLHFDDVAQLQKMISSVSLEKVRPAYTELILSIRNAGLPLSDRRAVKLQRAVAASALLCGRMEARVADFWVLRHAWDADEQRIVLAGLVENALAGETRDARDHPQSRATNLVDAEELAKDLESIAESLPASGSDLASLRDRLGILEGRIQWVSEAGYRDQLAIKAAGVWNALSGRK